MRPRPWGFPRTTAGGGEIGILDGFGAEAGVDWRRFPAQKINGRELNCIVVADERGNMV